MFSHFNAECAPTKNTEVTREIFLTVKFKVCSIFALSVEPFCEIIDCFDHIIVTENRTKMNRKNNV